MLERLWLMPTAAARRSPVGFRQRARTRRMVTIKRGWEQKGLVS